jgi:hypothetical protein
MKSASHDEARQCYSFLMRSASKAVAAFLMALTIGATPLNVCAPTAECSAPPQQDSIGTAAVRPHVEFATEPVLTRLLLSKPIERRTSDSFTLPSRIGLSNSLHVFIRIARSDVTRESVARVSTRGRAPPV